MKTDDPAALRFILQDDVYLLHNDRALLEKPVYITPEKTPAEPVTETPAMKFNYLGGHKKKFLIAVHYTGHEFIADDHLTALENILKRKEYALDDVAILNMATAAVSDAEQLLTHFDPQKLLILGKDALPAKIETLTLNQPKQVAGCMVLYSFSFDDMMNNTENKKAFWDQMKNL